MKYNRLWIFALSVFLIIALAACERPASRAPTDTTPTSGGFPVPGATDDVMSQLESFATQTAMALSGGAPATPTTPETAAEASPTAQPTEALQAATPTSAPIVVPTATPGIPSSYTLRTGEHPYCIARRFDVNPEEMLRLSGLRSGGTYSAGTVLKIPQGGGGFPAKRSLKSHPTTYTASSGDSIYSIACEFGDVDPNAIIAANNLQAPYKLESGQTLNIP